MHVLNLVKQRSGPDLPIPAAGDVDLLSPRKRRAKQQREPCGFARMAKILDLSDVLRLADRGDLPLPHWVPKSRMDVKGIFVTLHADVTRGSAPCCAESAKALLVKEFEYLDHTGTPTCW